MKSRLKRILSAIIVLCLCLSLLPNVTMPAEAASTGLTLSQLRQKFPHGKYWNHAGNPGSSNSVNNQDGYTSTPCSQHGVVGTSKQTCNGFQPSGTQLSWQCMGYAEKLGYDATGYNPRNNANGWYTYTSSSALDNLKPGDIVRYKNNVHSIYVTGVNGDTVTYTDCNSDGHCIIRWNVTISKSTLRSSFTHVRSAPSSVSPGSTSCSCSTSYAGTYICTTSSLNLTIRSGHGSSYSAIGSIPPGATVTVSKASGTSSSDWAHVTYNGVTGYASMQYLSKKQATQQRDSRIGLWLSDSEMGSSISTIRTGEWLYLCYKLYDANTGDLLDTYNTSGGYTAKLTLYETNGAVAHTYTYTNDNSWISIKRTTPGKYKGELVFTWNSGGTTTSTVSINMVYEPRVTPSASDIQLNVTGTNSQTISISYSGATSSNSIYLDCTTSGDCFSYKWGSWSDHKMPLTITGVRAGQGIITIEMYDSDTDQIIATSKVYVTVTAPTYTVSYNANGGSGAPGSQTKYYNTALTLSSTKPTRTGYTFLGWSTSSTATSASYQSGGSFTSNTNTTLYAVWKANTYTVTYNANGGTGAPSSQTKTYGKTLTLSSNKPTRTGYTFLGWSTSSTATSATYQSGGSFTSNANTTLYAVWKANTTALSVNSTNSAVVSAGGEMKYFTYTPTTSGKYVIYSTGSDDTKVYLYNDNASGTELDSDDDDGDGNNFRLEYNLTAGTTYTFGVKYYNSSKTGTISFKFGNVYTVAYNANGGSGAPSAQSKDYATNIILSSTKPTRTGYTFLGWSTSSTATSATYAAGASFTTNANTTLYAVWKANTYTISYNANGGSGAPSSQTKTYGKTLTLSSTKPTRTGYTFTGWNTKADGTGTAYAAGASYTANAGATLYAQWQANTYTVTYNANGGSGAPSSQTKTYGKTLTLSSTKPTRTGYTFTGWNTKADGTGTAYAAGASYTANAGATLYAQWQAVDYTVSYNANGGSGAPSSQTKTYGKALTLSSTKPTRTGYTFLGWNTKADGTGTAYAAGASYTSNAGATLYAQWQANTYTVTYNANGGSGTTASSSHTYGTSKALTANAFTRTGYSFLGWSTNKSATTATYTNKQSVKNLTSTANGTVTLYAIWKINTYTIKYDANGGDGAPSNQTKTHGTTLILSGAVPERAGYTFLGWSTSSTAVTATYQPNTSFTINANTTLYAVWKFEEVNEEIVLPVPEKPYKITNVVSGIHVYWKATENITQYGLWRSETGEDGTYEWIANPTVPHFTDTNVESGKTYFYKVTSSDSMTNTHSDMSEAIDGTYVATPDIISRVNRAVGIGLGWDKIDGAKGYAIYRKSYAGNDAWVRIATISDPDTLSWDDTSVKNANGTIYRYTIRALTGDDLTILSGCRNTGRTMVRITSLTLNSATKKSSTSIKCSWNRNKQATGYEVRFMVGDTVYKTYTIGNNKTVSKTVTGLPKGQTYKIQVRSYKKVDGVGSFYSAWSTAKNVKL